MLSRVHIHIDFEAQGAFAGPAFEGSMLRGAFGAALKRTVCVMKLRDCAGCPLERACIYTTVFETRPPDDAGVMRLYERAPQPFTLGIPNAAGDDAPIRRAEGEVFHVSMHLFGDAARATPFVLRALEEAGQRGFGPGRIPHAMIEARDGAGSVVWRRGGAFAPIRPEREIPPPLPNRTLWQFASPLRLKRDGKLLRPETLTAANLIMATVRRLGLLSTFFGEAPPTLDFKALKAAAQHARLYHVALNWREVVRRSSRQNATLSMGGLVGEVTLDLGGDVGLAAALAWAPIIHVGKGTSMGLGRVEIAAA